MKLEALMLRSLCAAGMLVCALVLGAMLSATPTTSPAGGKTLANAAQPWLPRASCRPTPWPVRTCVAAWQAPATTRTP